MKCSVNYAMEYLLLNILVTVRVMGLMIYKNPTRDT